MVDRKETLSGQSGWINSPATEVATHVHRDHLIKSWCLVSDLSVARSSAVKRAALPANVEIAVAIHIQRSENGLVRDVNWRLPCNSGIARTVKQSARAV